MDYNYYKKLNNGHRGGVPGNCVREIQKSY